MKILITADWHLTSRPIDEYRWELFPWLKRQCENREVDALFIAGDIADLKDNHPALFVNRLVDECKRLAQVLPLYVIPGNHDYIDPTNPFFRFLRLMPNVSFFTKPTPVIMGEHNVLFLPHTKRWRSSWGLTRHAETIITKGYDLIILHQPFKGATMESGETLEEGLTAQLFKREIVGKGCAVIAGDIHVPQEVGNVTYTGAPYPIHFGDDFRPRVLLWEDGALTSLKRSSLKKAMITGTGPECLEGLSTGDMARVKLHLPRSEFVDWQKRRREIETRAQELGVELCGVEVKEAAAGPQRVRIGEESEGVEVENPADRVGTFRRFCRAQGIKGDLLKQGLEVLQ